MNNNIKNGNLSMQLDNLSGLISYSDEIDFTNTDKYQINFRLL